MKQKKTIEKAIEPSTSKTAKGILLQILKDEINNIQGIYNIYYKIDNEKRLKITNIVSMENHYEDV
ncbi:MAG: hypothetical protein LBH16_01690 [Treponema sp.]|jgi:hypothetical protein|nr:hypothetical protein [Treponema sp.]